MNNAPENMEAPFPHYESIEIFSYAQKQLTLQSVIGSGQILRSSKVLCILSLPASIK